MKSAVRTWALASTFLVFAFPLWAGTKDGGGGIGVLCGERLRTLDLYEAEEVYQLPLSQRYADLDTNLAAYGAAFASYMSLEPVDPTDPEVRASVLTAVKEEIFALFRDIPPGTALPPSHDATLPPLQPGCSFVQLAIWSDLENVIYRDPVLWARLSPQDQTALVLHEAIYKGERLLRAKTSDNSRRFVGRIMSDLDLEPMLKPLWGVPRRLWCTFPGADQKEIFEFYAIDESREGRNGLGVYFTVFKDNLELTRTSTFISGVSLDQFWNSDYARLQGQGYRDSYGDSWQLEVEPETPQGVGQVDVSLIRIRAWNSMEPKPAFTSGFCKER